MKLWPHCQADMDPVGFREEGCKAWQELCMEAGGRANPGQAAEGKGHRLWGTWCGQQGVEARGQQGQPRKEQERSEVDTGAEAVCLPSCSSLGAVCSPSLTRHMGKSHGHTRSSVC